MLFYPTSFFKGFSVSVVPRCVGNRLRMAPERVLRRAGPSHLRRPQVGVGERKSQIRGISPQKSPPQQHLPGAACWNCPNWVKTSGDDDVLFDFYGISIHAARFERGRGARQLFPLAPGRVPADGICRCTLVFLPNVCTFRPAALPV